MKGGGIFRHDGGWRQAPRVAQRAELLSCMRRNAAVRVCGAAGGLTDRRQVGVVPDGRAAVPAKVKGGKRGGLRQVRAPDLCQAVENRAPRFL